MSSLSQAERSSGRPCPGDHDPTGCAACNRDCRVKPGNDMRGAHAETRHPRRDLRRTRARSPSSRPCRGRRCRANAALIKIGACGVCGTDQHILKGHWPKPLPWPFTLGHEIGGVIVEKGAALDRGFHGQAARRRLEGDDPAADAVRALLLLRPLSRERQQVPDPGLLRALSRLRQAAAPVGRLGRVRLCRSRHAARHQDLQAAGRHAAAARRARRAADLLHPRLQPRDPRRRLPMGRHGRHPGLRADRHSGGRGGAGDGCRPGDLRRRAGGAAARAGAQVRRRGDGRHRGGDDAGGAHRRACARSSAASAPTS